MVAAGAYTRMRFSDTNQADDMQGRTEFAVVLAPRITVGYQARADYARQSGSGFFDPSDLVSHRVSASVELEGRKVFAFVQIYGGHQKFVRNAFETSEWAKGGRVSFGVRPTEKFEMVVNVSAGDFRNGERVGVSGIHGGVEGGVPVLGGRYQGEPKVASRHCLVPADRLGCKIPLLGGAGDLGRNATCGIGAAGGHELLLLTPPESSPASPRRSRRLLDSQIEESRRPDSQESTVVVPRTPGA